MRIVPAAHLLIWSRALRLSGGVDVDNVKDWIKAGAVAVGAGSSLIKGAKTGDYDLITETGKLFVERIKEARAEMKK